MVNRVRIRSLAFDCIAFSWLCWSLVCILDCRLLGQGADLRHASFQSATGETKPNPLEDLDSRVDGLIQELGNRNYRQRVTAQWELQQLGLAAFEKLRVAANTHENIQIAGSARYIIDSQDIVWWRETDSARVRSYLNDYGLISKDERKKRILLLATDRASDAWLALCRLARFERDDDLSRAAGLALMEGLVKESNLEPTLVHSLDIAIGDGQRPGIQWIRLLLQELLIQPANSLDRWMELAEAELERQRPSDRGEASRAQLRRFYTWLGGWLTKTSGREDALQAVRPSLKLVEDHPNNVQSYARWALDNHLPELLEDLHVQHTQLFQDSGQLTYLLAESYLLLGEKEKAQETALVASDRTGNPNPQARRLSRNLSVPGMVASNRAQRAIELAARGLFDWSEREYQQALAENSERFDRQIRESFSEFYWLGGEHGKAANILRPLAIEAEQKKPTKTPRRRFQDDSSLLLSTYYYYDGLAKTDFDDVESAKFSLHKAYDYSVKMRDIGINPDIVIAMKQVIATDEDQEFFEQCFSTVRDDFRRFVVENEEQLAMAADRGTRRQAEIRLGMACNQLAWLLGKCQMHTSEAVRLSRRSLELRPDYPIYLDTLARCHFADGEFTAAIETQRKAISLAPHERQMKAQLAEFEHALSEQDGKTTRNEETEGL